MDPGDNEDMHMIIPVVFGYIVCVLRRIVCARAAKKDDALYLWVRKQRGPVVIALQCVPAIGGLLSAVLVCVAPVISGGPFVKIVIFFGVLVFELLVDDVGFAAKRAANHT